MSDLQFLCEVPLSLSEYIMCMCAESEQKDLLWPVFIVQDWLAVEVDY